MKKIIILFLATFLATNIYADSSNKNKSIPPGQSNAVVKKNKVKDVTATVPPGLSNKETPPGLSKQNKVPSGWSEGEKTGWDKSEPQSSWSRFWDKLFGR